MLWLALHFHDLPLEVFTRGSPTPAPLVILDNNRVCHRNQAAVDKGIELGTTLATAHSICANLLHQHKNPAAEHKRLKELAHQLYRYSSYISLQAPDCVLIEIAGSLRLFGSHTELAHRAQSLCQSLGHQSYAKVAQTPWAAIALGRANVEHLRDVSLNQAGLELAGIHSNVIERLDNMGIYTLGPLLDLPNGQLGRRFGKKLLTYLQRLTGIEPDPRSAVRPPHAFKEAIHLLQPITDKSDLYASPKSPMCMLAQALQQWLVTHQLGCERATWRFVGHKTHSNQVSEEQEITVRFAQAKQSATDILHISELKMESQQLPTEVLSIELRSLRLQRWHGHSQNLFSFQTGQQIKNTNNLGHGVSPDAFELVSELNARLGDRICRGISAMDQHSPEAAWSYKALNALADVTEKQSAEQPPLRPLWLFDPPHPIRRSEITLLHGPERIQSNWWENEIAARDYYIARHDRGAECWAFRALKPADSAEIQSNRSISHTARNGLESAGLKASKIEVAHVNETDLSNHNLKEQWYLHGYFG